MIHKNTKQKEKYFSKILHMIYERRFVGFTGQAIKNSIYQFLTTATAKIGSLVFTIVLARLLFPELFGLYSLALSTIVLFASFSDFGINHAIIRYVSKFLGENKKAKAKAYFKYLIKLKAILILVSTVALILSASFIANNYYNKPLFLALLAGAFYILSLGFLSSVETVFFASNKFKYPFYKEIIFQILRLIIIPLTIIITITNITHEISLFIIILAIAFAYFISLIATLLMLRKNMPFIHLQSEELTKKERTELWKFILPLSATVLSGVFFGYIDMIMLGRFVIAQYIGYYKAAFSLIGSLVPFIALSHAVFPIFSRLSGKKLDKTFKQTRRVILFFSIFALIGTFIFAEIAIKLIFGTEYLEATNILRILSILLIGMPITSLYSSYLISKGKTQIMAKLLISSTLINIVLNYFLITWLVKYSFFMAIVGATIATIISRYIYLFGLMFATKNQES